MSKKVVAVSSMVASVVLLGGCASSSVKNFDAFQKIPLQATDNMPSKAALAGAKPRVIVFNFDDKKSGSVGEEVSDKVTKELNETNNVNIVDRALAQRLGQEIQLAETKGRTGYRGQDVADFAITGKITSAGARVSFTAATSWVDKEGKSHLNPAKCTTSGKVSFSLKISQVPSLDVIKTIDKEGSASVSEDAKFFGLSDCPALTEDAAKGIISAAAGAAVRKAHTELKNQFAPTGYVLERRQFEENNLFKVSLGQLGGAKQDLAVVFLRTTTDTNPLTGQVNIEQVKIAEGVISDQLADSYSFILVKDGQSANKVKLGDSVKVKFEDSFADKLNNALN